MRTTILALTRNLLPTAPASKAGAQVVSAGAPVISRSASRSRLIRGTIWAAVLGVMLVGCGVSGRQTTSSGQKKALAMGTPGGAAVESAPTTGAPVVVIDPGHNGMNWAHMDQMNRRVSAGPGKTGRCNTAGTTSLHGYTEAAYVFDLASRLVSPLKSAGVTVILTRPDNAGRGPCIDERAAIANQAQARLSVSIHGEGWPIGRGFHILYPAPTPGVSDPVRTGSERLALDIRQAFAEGTGMPYATYTGKAALSPGQARPSTRCRTSSSRPRTCGAR